MTLETGEHVFGVSEAQIALVTKNTATEYKIGTRMSIPDLSSLDITVSSEKKECKAGLTVVASKRKKTGYSVKFENVAIDLKVLAAINGSTMAQTGTTPSQINQIVDSGDDIPALFNMAFICNDVDGAPADLHYEYFAVSGLIDVQQKLDDYCLCSFEGDAVARKKPLTVGEKQVSNPFRMVTEHETSTTIAADDTTEGNVTV